jgi:hypothetical protein
MKDIRALHHFMGVSIQYQVDELFLTQHQFAHDILERPGMVDCKPVLTSIDTQAKVSVEFGHLVVHPTHFRSLAGVLKYLTFTHSDIAYAIQQVCLHMHDLREPYLTAMKHILRYLWASWILDFSCDALPHPS